MTKNIRRKKFIFSTFQKFSCKRKTDRGSGLTSLAIATLIYFYPLKIAMKNSFVRNSFVVSRHLAFNDKARELSRARVKSSEASSMSFEYTHGAPSYPDGNQTLIKTTTGIWEAVYNALNRPVSYTRENEDGTRTVITADYDYMGRRVFKKVETVTTDSESGEETRTVLTNHRFLYRGYLQIAVLDLTRSTLNDLWLITWDPTDPVATRPLAIQKDSTWYTYGLDLPKNITEVYGTNGGIRTAYTYTPYGQVTASGSVTQPLQWSSEYADTDLGLVYYNYRHYTPLDGRWTGRDPLWSRMEFLGGEDKQINYDMLFSLYKYVNNTPIEGMDILGLASEPFRMDLQTKYCKGVIVASYSENLRRKIKRSSWKQMALDEILSLISDHLTGRAGTQVGAAAMGTKALWIFAHLVYVCSCPTNSNLIEKDIIKVGVIDFTNLGETMSEATTKLRGIDRDFGKKCRCDEKKK